MATKADKIVFACVCAAAVLLAAVCVFLPYASIALLPLCLCLLGYVCARRPWLMLAFGAAYALFGALLHGGNLLTVTGAVLFAVLTPVLFVRKKLPPVAFIAVGAGACLLAVLSCVGAYALVRHGSMADSVVHAIGKTDDPLLAALSGRYYRKLKAEDLGHAPLLPADELYASEALGEYAHSIGRELENDALWYTAGYGTFVGLLTTFVTLALLYARRMSPVKIRDLRLGHGYLKAVVLPVVAFSLLGLYAPLSEAARTVLNVFVVLPTAFCGITLLLHCAGRFYGKARVAAYAVFWLLMAAAVLFWEWGLIVLGFLGLADVILNVRKCLDWALG